MQVDDGVRNTTGLLILMFVPLIVASCQHTFGLGDRQTMAQANEEQAKDSAIGSVDHTNNAEAIENESGQPELLVSSREPATSGASDEWTDKSGSESTDLPSGPITPHGEHSDQVGTSDVAESEDSDANPHTQSVETGSQTVAETTQLEKTEPPMTQLASNSAAKHQQLAEASDATTAEAEGEPDEDDSQESDENKPHEDDSQKLVGLDATAEFESWSVKLEDTIRAAVLKEILSQLEMTTAKLDMQQARLESLLIETELYRMQIQHLQNRRQEWEPAE